MYIIQPCTKVSGYISWRSKLCFHSYICIRSYGRISPGHACPFILLPPSPSRMRGGNGDSNIHEIVVVLAFLVYVNNQSTAPLNSTQKPTIQLYSTATVAKVLARQALVIPEFPNLSFCRGPLLSYLILSFRVRTISVRQHNNVCVVKCMFSSVHHKMSV